MSTEISFEKLIRRVDALESEIERLKRDLFHSLVTQSQQNKVKSLFGSVRGGDVTENMVNEAKRSLFRNLEDL